MWRATAGSAEASAEPAGSRRCRQLTLKIIFTASSVEEEDTRAYTFRKQKSRGWAVKRVLSLLSILVLVGVFQPSAVLAAQLVAQVSISTQTMTVVQGGKVIHSWKVSTARRGKVTPVGSWTAKWLSRNHRSSRYNNAPMPYAIFYNGHYAVHGTDQIGRLGTPASAGCIRLHPQNAAKLFALAQQVGLKNTRIVVRR